MASNFPLDASGIGFCLFALPKLNSPSRRGKTAVEITQLEVIALWIVVETMRGARADCDAWPDRGNN